VGRPHLLPEEQMHTFWCFDQAMQFLKTRDPSAPYFLKISVIDPHPPLTPPAFYYQRYIDRKIPSPVVGDWAPNFGGPQKGLATDASEIHLPEQDMRCARAAYYGMINFVDDQVGRLMQFEANEAREWFIIFTSDHGEMLGDHNLYRKTWPYEASARIPFLVRAPDSWDLPGEQVCESPVGLQDVMPTILDATGVDIPDTCTGKSLLPIIRGDATAVRDFLHGEHSGCYRNDQGNHFLTDGHEKYIWYSQTGVEQLFDLDADPHETVNLADKPNAQNTLGAWRAKLVVILDGRPEGFTDGKSLVPGRPHGTLLPGYDPDAQYPFL
jgi:arylsulfatase A-like enzyme